MGIIEHGKIDLLLSRVAAIAQALHTTPKELLFPSNNVSTLDTQEMNTMNNLENKHRKQRIELANNLTLAAVTVTAIVNTIAVILKIAR